MSNLKKILTVLSLAALATISQASSMHYGSSSDAEKFAESMESDDTSLALNQPTGERFTLKEQTVEYLLEKQNRNQLDEILNLINDVTVTQ